MISIVIILLCWFVDMPLWLSITGTVLASLQFIFDIGTQSMEN